MKTTVDCSVSQPKSWYETCNTIKIVPYAPYNGRYSNENVIVYCGCRCHTEGDIIHFMECCNYSYHRIRM